MNFVAEMLAKGVGEPASRAAQAVVDVATMRQVAQARALRMNSTLRRFGEMLADSANIRAGLILIPCPWGSSAQWGLSRDERDCLRAWVTAGAFNRRIGKRQRGPITYDAMSRRWAVTGSGAAVGEWVATHPVTADDVLQFWPDRSKRTGKK